GCLTKYLGVCIWTGSSAFRCRMPDALTSLISIVRLADRSIGMMSAITVNASNDTSQYDLQIRSKNHLWIFRSLVLAQSMSNIDFHACTAYRMMGSMTTL